MSSTFVDDPRDRAFERLYERYVREVYRYVLAVLRNPSEAEDVTQTTFLNAYRAIQAGAEPQRPHNWLIAIAHNACRSRVRFAMRRPKEVPLDEFVEQLTVLESERLNVRELLHALGRLPFKQRAALTMRELEGRSYPEIAENLGVTIPAVEALIARARKSLRLQSAAFRGLTLIQVPRSLRKLFDPAETAGSAIGAGAAAKAAAVLVAGFVAGGVGSVSTVEAQTPPGAPVTRVELRRNIAPPSIPAHRLKYTAQRNALTRHTTPTHAGAVPQLSPDSSHAVGSAAPASAFGPDPSPPAALPASPPPAIAASASARLPQPPPLPVELPQLADLPVPAIPVPAIPPAVPAPAPLPVPLPQLP
jgi:RNA polymerase sigma factor (sigma-70 family)